MKLLNSFWSTLLFVLILAACNETTSNSNATENWDKGETVYFVELRNVGPELRHCFGKTLFNKSYGPNLSSEDKSQLTSGNQQEKHLFLDFSRYSEINKPTAFRKIIVTLHRNQQPEAENYSIEEFLPKDDEKWRRVLNMGKFSFRDHSGKPTSQNKLSSEECCAQIRRMIIRATYK